MRRRVVPAGTWSLSKRGLSHVVVVLALVVAGLTATSPASAGAKQWTNIDAYFAYKPVGEGIFCGGLDGSLEGSASPGTATTTWEYQFAHAQWVTLGANQVKIVEIDAIAYDFGEYYFENRLVPTGAEIHESRPGPRHNTVECHWARWGSPDEPGDISDYWMGTVELFVAGPLPVIP